MFRCLLKNISKVFSFSSGMENYDHHLPGKIIGYIFIGKQNASVNAFSNKSKQNRAHMKSYLLHIFYTQMELRLVTPTAVALALSMICTRVCT